MNDELRIFEDEENRLFDDNPQIAFLMAQKDFPLRYKPVRHAGKIKFLVFGDGLEKAIQNFFANDEIAVQDYLSAFTTIKNIVAAMKDRG
jgi:hypothetical protein